MWGAGEPDLFEAIELEDALAFIQIAKGFEGNAEKVFKWFVVWISKYFTLFEIPKNEHNLTCLVSMVSLRLELDFANTYLHQLNETGELYTFNPQPTHKVIWRDDVRYGLIDIFGRIGTTNRFEQSIQTNARKIADIFGEQIERPRIEWLSEPPNPLEDLLIRRPPINNLEEAIHTRKIYHGPSNSMILWFCQQDHTHSKLALCHPPNQYAFIGQCNGTTLEQTNHAPSYGIPYTSNNCDYLYCIRSQAVFGSPFNGEQYDLVRFNLRRDIALLRHEEVVISDIARHTPGWFLHVDEIVGADNDNSLTLIANIKGRTHGAHLIELNLQNLMFSVISPLFET